MKEIIFNIIAAIWFIAVLLGTLFFGTIFTVMVFFFDIVQMLKTGFSVSPIGFVFCFIFGLVFAITGFVPVFRRCYYKLPWLYPYCVMLTMNLFIISIAESILAKGFSVISTPRHIITVILMLVQVIGCRIAMSVYFNKYPMILHKYDRAA
ncbi:hypothetical protein [Pseudobutyrivibrio ruminis]|uniref:hypothetical protein n=1 Tax=Pseudobutyrivibrio ruminis TaxID=46206 RepID=UPI00068A3018|nr:hypothetical protein [Pseudobutyrivibrio ruminis]